jgi:hypothetical protein
VHPIPSSGDAATSENVTATETVAVTGSASWRPAGCRPRALPGIAHVLDVLAGRIAESPAVTAARSAGGTTWLVTTRDHRWRHPLWSTSSDADSRHRIALGLGDVAVELAKAAMPTLVPAAAGALGGRRSRGRNRRGRGGRVPLVTEQELTTLWLAALLGALRGTGWSGRLHIGDLTGALRSTGPGDSVLLADITTTAVLWLPRRGGSVGRRTTALAHWTLVSGDGNVTGAGVVSDR